MSHHSSFLLGRALAQIDKPAADLILLDVSPSDMPGVRRGLEDVTSRPHRHERHDDLAAFYQEVAS